MTSDTGSAIIRGAAVPARPRDRRGARQCAEARVREGLAAHLPDRALPITTAPLDKFEILVDRQYRQITDLLQKGRRRTPEARALVRGLLAMEGHVAEDVRVSERDVNRRALTATRSLRGRSATGEVITANSPLPLRRD